MKNKTLLIVLLLVTAIGAGGCFISEEESRKRENTAWNNGETYGREEARQQCKVEKLEIQAAHKIELENAVAGAIAQTKLENAAVATGGFIGGVSVSLLVTVASGILILLLTSNAFFVWMATKKDDADFKDFFKFILAVFRPLHKKPAKNKKESPA